MLLELTLTAPSASITPPVDSILLVMSISSALIRSTALLVHSITVAMTAVTTNIEEEVKQERQE